MNLTYVFLDMGDRLREKVKGSGFLTFTKNSI